MKKKAKYQYTYSIYPYRIAKKQYEKYIFKLIKDRKIKIKLFEKEKDLDIYTYFTTKTKEYVFPSFEYTREEKRKLEKKEPKQKAKQMAKENCIVFEYQIGNDVQGKIGKQDGIFFKIEKI